MGIFRYQECEGDTVLGDQVRRWLLSIVVAVAALFSGIVIGERRAASSLPTVPNVDFYAMAIATEPVNATAYGSASKVRIKAWERCALGLVTCDKRPRTVEAICLGTGATVLIDESSWAAFRRIPDEDLQHVSGQSIDMNLCPAR